MTNQLTERETQVFEMIGHGMTSKAIANKLNLGQKTIETHREKIKAKLGLGNAVELVRAAVLRVTPADQTIPVSRAVPDVDLVDGWITLVIAGRTAAQLNVCQAIQLSQRLLAKTTGTRD